MNPDNINNKTSAARQRRQKTEDISDWTDLFRLDITRLELVLMVLGSGLQIQLDEKV